MNLYEKSLQTIELPAVLELLAAKASSEGAKAMARALRPAAEAGRVRERLAETTCAKTMEETKGSPSFSGLKDVRPSLARAEAARIFRRMSASSVLAPSAISSSPVMAVVIFSSRNRLGLMAVKYRFSTPQSPRPEA